MTILRRLSVLLPLCLLASQTAHAIPCGGVGFTDSCDSFYGTVKVTTATGPLQFSANFEALAGAPGVPVPYSKPERVNNVGISTIFAPNNVSVVARNQGSAPAAYQIINVGTAGAPINASDPLTLASQSQSNFAVMNVAGVGGPYAGWDYAVYGNLFADPASSRPLDISSGALSMLFDYSQYAVGFNLVGIDVTNATTNPNPQLFVDFFDPRGVLVEHIAVGLPRLSLTDPAGRALIFTSSSANIAGMSITTSDTFGLFYGVVSYATSSTPIPSSLLLFLGGFAWLLRPWRGRPLFPEFLSIRVSR